MEKSKLKTITLEQFVVARMSAERVEINYNDPATIYLAEEYMAEHPDVTSVIQAVNMVYAEECKRRGW